LEFIDRVDPLRLHHHSQRRPTLPQPGHQRRQLRTQPAATLIDLTLHRRRRRNRRLELIGQPSEIRLWVAIGFGDQGEELRRQR
jgi:hypothetical protein